MLNDSELQMFGAILEEALIQSKVRNDVDPEYHDIDVNNLNIFNDKLNESQVYDSLAMKGFIECISRSASASVTISLANAEHQ